MNKQHQKIILCCSAALLGAAALYSYLSRPPEGVPYIGTVCSGTAAVKAADSGSVKEIAIAVGDSVKHGDKLIVLERPDLNDKLAAADTALSAARRQLMGLSPADSADSTSTAASGSSSGGANIEVAKAKYEKYKQLYEQGGIARKKFEAARDAYLAAQQPTTPAGAAADSAPPPENITVVKMKVDHLHTVWKAALEKVKALTAVAPFDGVVTDICCQTEQTVAAGDSLLSVSNGEWWIDVYIDSADISRLQPGQNVTVTDMNRPPHRLTGTIIDISQHSEFISSADNQTASMVFAVKVAIDNQGSRFQPGAEAKVYIRP